MSTSGRVQQLDIEPQPWDNDRSIANIIIFYWLSGKSFNVWNQDFVAFFMTPTRAKAILKSHSNFCDPTISRNMYGVLPSTKIMNYFVKM